MYCILFFKKMGKEKEKNKTAYGTERDWGSELLLIDSEMLKPLLTNKLQL